jgi:hypothetical protein
MDNIVKEGDVLVCKKRDTIGAYPDTLHLLEIGKHYRIERLDAINSTIGLFRAYILIDSKPVQFYYPLDINLVRNQLNMTKHRDEIDYVNKLIDGCYEWGLLTYFDTVENFRELQLNKLVDGYYQK